MRIRVLLLVGNLPLYSELFQNPPKGIEYIGRSSGALEYYSLRAMIKRKLALKIIKILKLPRMMYLMTSADLIHSNRGILILNKKPWVIDLDHASAFVGFDHLEWEEKKYRKIVRKFLSSNYCKKIMAWSIAAKRSLLNSFLFNEEIKKKIEVIYPATKLFKKSKSKEKFIKLLFVGSLFEEKGGMEVLEAFKIIREKYDNVKLIVKSDVPLQIKRVFNFPDIEYYPYKSQILPREKLIEKFFARADIFVYPTYFDIFGLCLLDALAVGLPIVATDVFAVPEIVEDNKNGFLIHSPIRWHDETYLWNPVGGSKKDKEFIVKQLVEKLSLLIEDSSLRRRMGRYSRRLVERGRFSIKERNEKLRKIYEEAIR
ncbi:MAG: glycosyltransferase family 4 protein [Candidatus Aenigmatarchaeota archaeon]